MSALRRTAVGAYRVEDAHTMAELQSLPRADAQARLLPVDSLFAGYPACTIGAKEERLCRCGSGFSVSAPDGVYRFYSAQGAFLMLGRVVNGQASTIKSFFEV